jgi:hypothetical protein
MGRGRVAFLVREDKTCQFCVRIAAHCCRLENSALWFFRQPLFEAKGNVISNIFFFGGSSGVPVMPATILISALLVVRYLCSSQLRM